MNIKTLQSIIKLTQFRDSDSLQQAMLRLITELIPLQEAMIYRPMSDRGSERFEQIIKVSRRDSKQGVITSEDKIDQLYIFSEDLLEIEAGACIKKCVRRAELIVDKKDYGQIELSIPVFIDQKLRFVLVIQSTKVIYEQLELVKALVGIYQNHLSVVNESERDKLTDLFNRRTFDGKLNRMLAAQKKKKQKYISEKNEREQRSMPADSSAWLAILDIDFFKRVNDEYGHIAGDEVLLRLSQKMMKCFRNSDFLFRFGGEEFVIILEPISIEMARAVLDRFRETIMEHQFPLVGTITVSIGFAKITENDFPATVLEYADKALYYSKDHGRNCVFNYEKLVEAGQLEETTIPGSVDLF